MDGGKEDAGPSLRGSDTILYEDSVLALLLTHGEMTGKNGDNLREWH